MFLDQFFLKSTQGELFALSQEILKINDGATREFFKVAFSGTIITKSGGVSLALDLGHTRPHIAKKVVDKFGNTIIGDTKDEYPPHSNKIMKSAFSEYEKKCLINIGIIPGNVTNNHNSEINFGNAQFLP